jgi:hypothetical protein
MAFPTLRNSTKALHTGWKVEATEGTPATLAQVDFTGDWTAGPINLKVAQNAITVGGQVGTTKLVPGKSYGELQNFKMPIYGEDELNIMSVAGAFVTVGTPNTYDFGGSAYNVNSGANAGRLSTTSLTFNQYDGAEKYILAGSRASSFKLGAKAGEILYIDATFQGAFTKANSDITLKQLANTSFGLDALKGDALTIGGTSYVYQEIEIDIKPDLKQAESAGSSTGIAGFELVNIDPTITISLYPGDPSVSDLWTTMLTNPSTALSWTFGSGVGNVYTLTGNFQIDSQESSYSNNFQVRKLVLKPVYNAATAYAMRISVQ